MGMDLVLVFSWGLKFTKNIPGLILMFIAKNTAMLALHNHHNFSVNAWWKWRTFVMYVSSFVLYYRNGKLKKNNFVPCSEMKITGHPVIIL